MTNNEQTATGPSHPSIHVLINVLIRSIFED